VRVVGPIYLDRESLVGSSNVSDETGLYFGLVESWNISRRVIEFENS
jgi:hypothetical protein